MTSDDMRTKFAALGIEYAEIGLADLLLLASLVQRRLDDLSAAGGMKMTVVFPELTIPRVYDVGESLLHRGFSLRVVAGWLSSREGITFGSFIGFAGWASTNNQMPFLLAFDEWCDFLNQRKRP